MSGPFPTRSVNRFTRFIDRLTGHPMSEPPEPTPSKATTQPPGQSSIMSRVLLINFDPTVEPDSHQTISAHQRWNRVDDLLPGFISDLAECSGGQARYQVVERQDVDDIPTKADGFTYSVQSLLEVLNRHAAPHNPDWMDYQRVVRQFNLYERIARDEIDEVWMFGFPYAGFYESRMAGIGAFWCNAPALENSQQCPRRFVMMGFNYERGVGEMLESYSHRVESIMSKVYERKQANSNVWERYIRYDKVAPGQAEVGTVHFSPNSDRDYDWGNPRRVPSRCDDWLNYPNLNGLSRVVNCTEWGNGDIRAHHRWWLRHLPHFPGTRDGISNNWWNYIVDPNSVRA